jgi:hypothetical protein
MKAMTAIALVALVLGAGTGGLEAQGRSGQAEKGKPAAQAKGGQTAAQPQAQKQAGEARGKAAQQKAQPGNAAARTAQQKAQPGNAAARAQGQSPAVRAANAARRGDVKVQPARLRSGIDQLAPDVRRLAGSNRASERMVAGAAARARLRGVENDAFDVQRTDDRVRVLNRRGDVLLDMNETRARDLGAWRLQRVGDSRNGNSPSFCRSGAGHPVWGREWCIDKGWGLGDDGGFWSRGRIDDVIFGRRVETDRLDRGTLLDVLGDVVLGRLSLHAITLGLTDPLVGTWVAEPDGPYVLRVDAGSAPVAELVDLDRDNRADILLVRHQSW